MKNYDEFIDFNYLNLDDWGNYARKNIIPLFKISDILLRLRISLEDRLKKNSKEEFNSNENIREILLGGISEQGNYEMNSLARIFKRAIGVKIPRYDWIYYKKKGLEPFDQGIKCVFKETLFLFFVKKLKAMSSKILTLLSIQKPQSNEDFENLLRKPEKILEYVKDLYVKILNFSPNYNQQTFFVLNTICVPRFYIIEAYPNLKESFDQLIEILILRSLLIDLSQLYGQGIGFIIFKNLGLISDSYIPRDHKIKILYIKPNSNLEEDIEAQKALCSLIWGMIGFTDRDFKIYSQLTFDVIFSIAKEKYEIFFDKIREPYLTLTKKNKGGIESDDSHFIIKLFIVKFISNELGYKNIDDLPKLLDHIKIEESNNLKVPDIYVTSEAEVYPNEAFEVETLFGQGTHAVKKLDETIEKYKELQPKVTKLNIVLDNLTFLMHMDEIRDKRKIHEKLREVNIRNFDLEFWTLNLKDNKLINFNDFSKELKILKNKNYLPIFQNQ